MCVVDTDCESQRCDNRNRCAAPRCDDEIQNGSEVGIDCGGDCQPCVAGRACIQDLDCVSSLCVDRVCQAASCNDQRVNGNETDLDCGGGCPPCAPTLGCLVDTDCDNGRCVLGRCTACAAEQCDNDDNTATATSMKAFSILRALWERPAEQCNQLDDDQTVGSTRIQDRLVNQEMLVPIHRGPPARCA